MKILVIGGMHGNEPLGIALVKSLAQEPIDSVDAIFANQKAIANDCRFINSDLNRSFPGDSKSSVYENRRAAEILKMTKDYDLVLDFHNTHCPDNDCGFIGEISDKILSEIAWLLGLNRIIVADYDCINKYASSCLSVEISLSSPENDVALWRNKIALIAKLINFKVSPVIEQYRFTYRMSLDDKKKIEAFGENLAAFQSISPELANKLVVEAPAYPIFINDKYTPYNYGGILNRLNNK